MKPFFYFLFIFVSYIQLGLTQQAFEIQELAIKNRFSAGETIAIINAKILTVDNIFSVAQAIAIEDDKIIAVGTNAEIVEYINAQTKIIDADGRTIVPGFIDGHAHMDREGLKSLPLSLGGASSIDEILDVIRQNVRDKKAGEWIITMPLGLYPNYGVGPDFLKENRYPTRHDLDEVAPNNPVYIKGAWYYWTGYTPIVSIANSAALRVAGINSSTIPAHEGLKILKDLAGEPNIADSFNCVVE